MKTETRSRPMEILLVEDNPGDIRLTKDALDGAKTKHRITVAEDGEVAMAMLRGLDPHGNAALPDLILLDLNLPKMDGSEVLKEIKGDPKLRRVPVVILTSSTSVDDISRTYDLGANAYVSKPIDLDEFIKDVREIESFWLTQVTLPPWV